MSSTKIVHLIDYFPHLARYQEYYLAEHQARLGHQVTVVTSDREWHGLKNGDPDSGIKDLPQGSFAVQRLRAILELRETVVILPELGGWLHKTRPDVVHVHGMIYRIIGWQASLYKRRLGYRLIFDVHEAAHNTNPSSDRLKALYHWLHARTLARSMARASDAIVAIGEEEKAFVCSELSIPSDRVGIIPLGVDCELFRPDPATRQATRRWLGLEPTDVAVVHSGKMSPQKDVHVLVKAMGLLLPEHPQLKLVLIGMEGHAGYKDYIMKLAQEHHVVQNLIWREFSPPDRLAAYFAACDIAVWPGNPSISILEAMASGLVPVLAADMSYGSLYTSFGNGLTFARGSERDLAEKIRSLLRTETREKMSTLSRKLAVERFSWESIARRFLELYSGPTYRDMGRNQRS